MSSISAERKSKKAKVVKASAPKSKTTGRSSGHPNYQTDKLLDIIDEAIKPLGSENWKAVARQYKITSGEELERDYNDLKIKFKKLRNLCAGKPTGIRSAFNFDATTVNKTWNIAHQRLSQLNQSSKTEHPETVFARRDVSLKLVQHETITSSDNDAQKLVHIRILDRNL